MPDAISPVPTGTDFCQVTGNVYALIADGVDLDSLPDFIPLNGTAIITANLPRSPYDVIRNANPAGLGIYLPKPIAADVVNGRLKSKSGADGVFVLATSPYINPQFFNYNIELLVTMPDEVTPTRYGPYTFDVRAGEIVDLANALPVAVDNGEPMLRGPQGEQGFPTDQSELWQIMGAAAAGILDLRPYNRSGTVTVDLTGPVTNILLPGPDEIDEFYASFSLTVIFRQPAAGNIAVTLPGAPVLYPDRIKPPIGTGANERTRLQFFYAANEWEIMLGSRNAGVPA